MASSCKSNGDTYISQMKPTSRQAAQMRSRGRRETKRMSIHKYLCLSWWRQAGIGTKGCGLRTPSGALDDLLPKQAVELNLCFQWPRLWAQAEVTLSLPSLTIPSFSLLAPWSSLAISSGIFCRGEVAVAGPGPFGAGCGFNFA